MVRCSKKNSEDCKTFKILGSGIGFEGGRYVAKTFANAAKRAGSKLFARAKASTEYKNKSTIKFIMGETTRGAAKSTKAYEVKRIALDTPKRVMIGGVQVVYKYRFEVRKLKNIPSVL